jgi:hypothetical protein
MELNRNTVAIGGVDAEGYQVYTNPRGNRVNAPRDAREQALILREQTEEFGEEGTVATENALRSYEKDSPWANEVNRGLLYDMANADERGKVGGIYMGRETASLEEDRGYKVAELQYKAIAKRLEGLDKQMADYETGTPEHSAMLAQRMSLEDELQEIAQILSGEDIDSIDTNVGTSTTAAEKPPAENEANEPPDESGGLLDRWFGTGKEPVEPTSVTAPLTPTPEVIKQIEKKMEGRTLIEAEKLLTPAEMKLWREYLANQSFEFVGGGLPPQGGQMNRSE